MSEQYIDAIRRDPADQVAWQRWFNASYSRLYYVLYWKTGGDVARSQDLAQEAMLRFVRYRGFEKTATDKDAVAYLVRTALNVLSGDRFPLPTTEAAVDQIADPAEANRAFEESSDLQRILAELPDDDRALLRMGLQGRTIAEIAKVTGVGYTTAASRQHRARKKAVEIAKRLQKKA